MAPPYRELDECLACGGKALRSVLDLGEQPLANSYHDNTRSLPAFPLQLNVCGECFHCQQKVAVDPDLMFRNYLYVSGTSRTLKDYFGWFAGEVDSRYAPESGPKKVLDIASNDGSQLAEFITRGWEAWGVDPAENLAGEARRTGATIVCDYWNEKVAGQIGEYFDCIVAQNVFAHTGDPLRFLLAARAVMHWDSKLLIQTSQADMFARGEFDTIYHEHVSFFSMNSLSVLAKRAGLTVEDIWITPVHGGSYVFVLGYGASSRSVAERFMQEGTGGRYAMETYARYAKGVQKTVAELKRLLENYRENGYAIAGYGAAAKGNTLLNFAKLSLDYIVDDNPLKHGLYTPGMNIPIYAPNKLEEELKPLVLIPLAWNFFDEIREKVRSRRPDTHDIFITYFPTVTVRE